MRPWSFQIPFIIVTLCAFLLRDAAPESSSAYLQLSPTVKAVLYSPDAGVKARVAVVNMHEDGNRLSDIAWSLGQQRSIGFLERLAARRCDWRQIPKRDGEGIENPSLRRQRRRAFDDLLSKRRSKRTVGLPGGE